MTANSMVGRTIRLIMLTNNLCPPVSADIQQLTLGNQWLFKLFPKQQIPRYEKECINIPRINKGMYFPYTISIKNRHMGQINGNNRYCFYGINPVYVFPFICHVFYVLRSINNYNRYPSAAVHWHLYRSISDPLQVQNSSNPH